MQLTEKSQQVLVQECHQVFVVYRNSITMALEAVYLGQLKEVYKEARNCCAEDDASKVVRPRVKEVGKHTVHSMLTQKAKETPDTCALELKSLSRKARSRHSANAPISGLGGSGVNGS